MKILTSKEQSRLIELLQDIEDAEVIREAISRPYIIDQIDKDSAIIIDRAITELLGEHIDEDLYIGAAFMLGIMQGILQKENSDQRTTADRSM